MERMMPTGLMPGTEMSPAEYQRQFGILKSAELQRRIALKLQETTEQEIKAAGVRILASADSNSDGPTRYNTDLNIFGLKERTVVAGFEEIRVNGFVHIKDPLPVREQILAERPQQAIHPEVSMPAVSEPVANIGSVMEKSTASLLSSGMLLPEMTKEAYEALPLASEAAEINSEIVPEEIKSMEFRPEEVVVEVPITPIQEIVPPVLMPETGNILAELSMNVEITPLAPAVTVKAPLPAFAHAYSASGMAGMAGMNGLTNMGGITSANYSALPLAV